MSNRLRKKKAAQRAELETAKKNAVWRIGYWDRFSDEHDVDEEEYESEEAAYTVAIEKAKEAAASMVTKCRFADQFDYVYVIRPGGSWCLVDPRYGMPKQRGR